MSVVINGTTGITNDGGYTGDGVVFADTTPANTLVTTTGGNVGIGTSSPASKLEVSTSTSTEIRSTITGSAGNVARFRLKSPVSDYAWYVADNINALVAYDYNAGAERARIDSSGNLLVGTTSANGKITVASSSSQTAGTFYRASSSAGDGVAIWYSDTGGAGTLRGVLRVDGGIANYSANNSNLSDERTKTDIVDAGNYLEKICAIPVRTYKYKDQTDNLLNLGVIAQEVEAVAPELVDVSGFGDTPDDGVPLKAVYQTDLQYALMKCIQEQQAIITTLTARVAALEGTQP